MPRVTIEWLAGRSKDQRDSIAREITDAVVRNAKVRPDQVTVVFKENLPEFQYKGGENYRPVAPSGS